MFVLFCFLSRARRGKNENHCALFYFVPCGFIFSRASQWWGGGGRGRKVMLSECSGILFSSIYLAQRSDSFCLWVNTGACDKLVGYTHKIGRSALVKSSQVLLDK